MTLTFPKGVEALPVPQGRSTSLTRTPVWCLMPSLSLPTFPSSAILLCWDVIFSFLVRDKVFSALLGIQEQHSDDCMKNERDQMSLDFFFFFKPLAQVLQINFI